MAAAAIRTLVAGKTIIQYPIGNDINYINCSCSFRFSDPCLLNPSDNDSKLSGQNTPDCRNGNGAPGAGIGNGNGDLEHQNKFFAALMEQINILHETNSKICRNLHETKGACVAKKNFQL